MKPLESTTVLKHRRDIMDIMKLLGFPDHRGILGTTGMLLEKLTYITYTIFIFNGIMLLVPGVDNVYLLLVMVIWLGFMSCTAYRNRYSVYILDNPMTNYSVLYLVSSVYVMVMVVYLMLFIVM